MQTEIEKDNFVYVAFCGEWASFSYKPILFSFSI